MSGRTSVARRSSWFSVKCATHQCSASCIKQQRFCGKKHIFFIWVCRHSVALHSYHLTHMTWSSMKVCVQYHFIQRQRDDGLKDTVGQSSWLSATIFSVRCLPTCLRALQPPHWWSSERLGPTCDIRIPLRDPLDPSHHLFPSRPLRDPFYIREHRAAQSQAAALRSQCTTLILDSFNSLQ